VQHELAENDKFQEQDFNGVHLLQNGWLAGGRAFDAAVFSFLAKGVSYLFEQSPKIATDEENSEALPSFFVKCEFLRSFLSM
jgi:hypothetical protein